MSKRISAIFFLTSIFSVFAMLLLSFFAGGIGANFSINSLLNKSFSESIESITRQNFPGKQALSQISISFKRLGGVVKINDVILTDNILMDDTKEPNYEYVKQAKESILNFAKQSRTPAYVMLIPTACAIKQQELPDFVNLFNQRDFIEDIYREINLGVSVVDTYLKLLTNQRDYIYYRTQSNLTAKGGYIVYSSLGKRLGMTPLRELEQFDISYGKEHFYGDLYNRVPYSQIEPDRITMYKFTKYKREYKVTHNNGGELKSYYTLFPQHTSALPAGGDVILGGLSHITDITTTASSAGKLLIFADKTALSYIPFLLVHYSQITIVDIENIPVEMMSSIDPQNYDQVLFGVSIETFIHTDSFNKLANTKDE